MLEEKRLSRKILRNMAEGETIEVKLPTTGAMLSGRVAAYQTQLLLGCRFITKSDFSNLVMTITRRGHEGQVS